jgi:hypothetical protein
VEATVEASVLKAREASLGRALCAVRDNIVRFCFQTNTIWLRQCSTVDCHVHHDEYQRCETRWPHNKERVSLSSGTYLHTYNRAGLRTREPYDGRTPLAKRMEVRRRRFFAAIRTKLYSLLLSMGMVLATVRINSTGKLSRPAGFSHALSDKRYVRPT